INFSTSRRGEYSTPLPVVTRTRSPASPGSHPIATSRYYDYYMQTISLNLPDDLLAQLDREAEVRGVTKSPLVRESREATLRQRSPGAGSCMIWLGTLQVR